MEIPQNSLSEAEGYITRNEVVELLGISLSTVHRMIQAKELEARIIGGRYVMIHRRSVYRYRDGYMTKSEVCEKLNVSLSTVNRMIKKNRFEVVRFGLRCTRINRRSFQQYFEQLEQVNK